MRSYLYATDLMVWLLWLLTGDRKDAVYNVGSEHDISIGESGETGRKLDRRRRISNPRQSPDAGWNIRAVMYPSTAALARDLGLFARVCRLKRRSSGQPTGTDGNVHS